MNETTKAQLKLAFETMRAAEIDRITVTFDGCGDSGQIEDVTTEPGDMRLPDTPLQWTKSHMRYDPKIEDHLVYREVLVPQEGKLEMLLEDFVYDLLGTKHAGWEINSGSFGEFRFDAKADKLEVEFNQRVEAFDTETYTLDDGEKEES